MRLIALSDTHNLHQQVSIPPGDFLIHAGDATSDGTLPELEEFLDWFTGHPHPQKIFVGGNHDAALEILSQNPHWWAAQASRGLTILLGEAWEYQLAPGALSFYGAPWRPRPAWARPERKGRHSAFGVMPDVIHERWARIPFRTDVLITHVPPWGIGDGVMSQVGAPRIGCPALREQLRRTPPRLHLFGHIHDDWGARNVDGTWHVNVTICDEKYNPSRTPTVIDITPESITFPAGVNECTIHPFED